MERIFWIAGYEVLVLVGLAVWVRRFGRNKDREPEFDWGYFLRASAFAACLAQLGFAILVSVMFQHEHSLAVGLVALFGIQGFIGITLVLMKIFSRRYKRLDNVIKRLEAMTADERERELASMPPEVFAQLPGDYRFVTRQDSKR